jgi:steroid delta-isomerase-like uncharacterized protein
MLSADLKTVPDPTASFDPKLVVRQLAEEVLNAGNLAAIETYIAPEYVRHDPSLPFAVRGPEGMRQIAAGLRAAFPDFHVDLDAITVSGDLVGTHWTAHGTHRGDYLGMPPTGRSFTVTALETFRLADGKVAEHWVVIDTASMLAQLGA